MTSTDRLARVRRPVELLRNAPDIGVWAGVVLAAAGVVLLAIGWGRTAGLTNVARQVPIVISAGFGGLGLIAVGLTVVNVSAKRADARHHSRQLAELRGLLTELRRSMDGDT
jgi:multisubunit Na+/H+ antiporter MnhB subunit